jgi:hypothetical protein
MPFANEIASDADIAKYKLRDINLRYHPMLRDMTCSWTVDRERDIFVRDMGTGREEFCNHHTFALHWKGTLVFWELATLDFSKDEGHYRTVWGLIKKNAAGIPYLPPEREANRAEIVSDFKEALKVLEAASFLAIPKSYSVDFQF